MTMKPGFKSSIQPCLQCLILIAALAAAACQGDPRAERIKAKDVAVNAGADPRSLDPSLISDLSSFRAVMNFTRGLTVLDAQGKPQPELAESWTVSPDGLVYDIKLRHTKWSNGDPLTADDVVYTWTRRMLNPKFGAEYAYSLFYIKGAREFFEDQGKKAETPSEKSKAQAPGGSPAGENTLGPESVGVKALAPDRLQVTLAYPTPFFPSLLAHNAYFPVSLKADQANPDWAKRAETYVGCGPFVMDHYRPGDKLTGHKNPNYWNAAKVALERITVLMIEDESTERGAFETGELDGTYQVPRTAVESLRGGGEIRFSPQYATNFLHFNCQHEVFKDVRVRRALALAVDREAIVKNVTRAGETPAFYVTPPALYRQPPQATFKDKQFDEARRLLAEAGHPGGKGIPKLRYIYNTMETHQQIAQVLQETWRRELGIEMEVQNQEFKVLINSRRAGTFDIARGGWQADFADPINFLEIFDSKSDNNDSHFVDAKYDAMLAAVRAEGDPVKREELMRKTEDYQIEQMPAIPLYVQTTPYLVTPRLEGYVNNPMGLFNAEEMRWKEK